MRLYDDTLYWIYKDVHDEEFYHLIADYWKGKATDIIVDREKKQVEFNAYNFVKCNFNVADRYGSFCSSMYLTPKYANARFLGENLSPNRDIYTIMNRLETIDRYCRLRLPDEYLEEFEKTHQK